MHEKNDIELLADYYCNQSDAAFAALAARHVNLVYSVALRQSRNPHHAEEITQAVFVILAKKAGDLSKCTILSGWLYHTARLTAANFLRGEMRRIHREQETYMQSCQNETEADPLRRQNPTDEEWREIAPLLETAMTILSQTDRDAIVLRFFENKNLREVGLALGASEEAAKKRVHRALDRLRGFFEKRGVSSTPAIIAGLISANSVQAAPAGLASSVAVGAAKGAALSGSTLTAVKGVMKIMAWTKTKITVVTGVVVLLAAGMAVETSNLVERYLEEKMRAEGAKTEAKVLSRKRVDETQGAALIDLKPFINTALTDSPSSPKGITANNLAQLPKGTNIYAGVPFDVEGTIQLMGEKFKGYGKVYPVNVENIPIGKSCAKIYLLHGESTIPWEQSGMAVAKLILHYASGGTEELNLVAGEQAFDFWGPTAHYNLRGKPEIKPAGGTELAWVGTNPWVQKWVPQFKLRLYRTEFANPRPAEAVVSCDYVSTMAQNTAPFLVGLTVE